ncbi:ATP-binding protein [Nocardioides terrisoli]|uniref:ATP-binding protein n=1 Tax=Nocardioides terrisoli TaxID=3388267 RepID=UPI00287B6AD6|nr:ATP-binding protein [Nocardioides marmorisolisilvae]
MAAVVVLAGPSGVGKSRLIEHLGLPVLRLDDFYKDGDDASLPHRALAGGAPIVDWDDPASWHLDDALATIARLCADGRAQVPVYDISRSARTGTRMLDLAGAPCFVAEGIFAQEVVAGCRHHGLLADAICVDRSRLLTFVLRLRRDLREHRKPPLVLLRRGLYLARAQRRIVEHARSLGCRVLPPDAAAAAIGALARPDAQQARS